MNDYLLDTVVLVVALIALVFGGLSIGYEYATSAAGSRHHIECGNQVPGR